MVLFKSKLILDKTIPIEKDFVFADYKSSFRSPLLDIKKCFGYLEITKYRNMIRMNVDLEVKVLLECSYSLEAFEDKINLHEEVLIGDSKSFDDGIMIIDQDEIEIESILLALITSSIPLKPIKPGAKRPESGEGYRVIDDEQLVLDRRKSGDSRFAKMDEIDFAEDDL